MQSNKRTIYLYYNHLTLSIIDFYFTLFSTGGLAQMVERSLCMR